MGLSHSPRIVTDRLVFCIDSENIKSYPGSGTTVVDVVNNLQGTLVGGVSFTQRAFSFDGVDDYISFADNNALDLASPFCIEIWVYPVAAITLYAKGQAGLHWNYGLLNDRVRHNNADYGNGTGYTVTNNVWQHIIVRYDETKNQVYKNGILVSDFTPTSYSPVQGSGILAIGRGGGSAFEYSNMLVSKFSLYNKKLLSDAEIQQNFNALRGRYGL
jgi:hypothetical protein